MTEVRIMQEEGIDANPRALQLMGLSKSNRDLKLENDVF